ncbi:MAG: GNAT family N-acetyltransferase [Planctomycetales bacterium]|nr:GNAT family N-acetyltransferase [Planctomycetales bacterium]NIM07689.1 GNAT family N-acetyltransferase [Planctomycetales bacterium]NIN07192.1 GNAT family N-acetyltransferase [Planctomycetales bacterium]NIN76285.1 GNAT family N-acetyltransferase [Planctomycetales bacterium]NIO33491.1 GNAT family N-acetyltransferase [Planctomycetales bacterium]
MKKDLGKSRDRSGTSAVIALTSAEQLRERAEQWDDLWRRSDVVTPGPRAEMIALWLETVGQEGQLHALAVEYEDQLVAALPLVLWRSGRTLRRGTMPTDDWSGCGELLWDPAVDATIALGPLVRALHDLKWSLLWWNGLPLETRRWRVFQQWLQAAGLLAFVDPQFEIGVVDIDHDWATYQAGWSRMHRRNMKRYARRLEKEAPLELRVFSQLAPEQVEPLLHRGFAVEDRSWKARSGSSVLRSDGMFAYFLRQAHQLARWGQLELVFLELGDRPIAFEMGWKAKGVYHSAKVGYDEDYAASSPGQLLRYRLFERFFADPQRKEVDFMGVLTDATAKWSTRSYPAGRMVVTRSGLVGRAVMGGYRHVWPQLRSLHRRTRRQGNRVELSVPA